MDSSSGGRREEGRELLHLEAAQRAALGEGGGDTGIFRLSVGQWYRYKSVKSRYYVR